ncbi:MAG: cation-transporting P-type ATPase [Pirellulales bacterium]
MTSQPAPHAATTPTSAGPEGGIAAPWSLTIDEVLGRLEVNRTSGLSSAEAAARLKKYGPNALPEPEPDSFLRRLWGQITGDAVVRLLLIGGIVSLLLGDYLEGAAILLMLVIMALFGLWQEGQANDAARSLRQADTPSKAVIRDGQRVEILITDLVPGDIVCLKSGDLAPADGRVLTSVSGEKNTAKLTGESLPVELSLEPIHASTVVNEQTNMLHRGDGLTAGNASMVVTSTGGATEIGRIAARLSQAEDVPTPLDEQLDSLGNTMAKLFLWLAVLVIGAGLARDFSTLWRSETAIGVWEIIKILKEAFINAVALIIAAIPEGLPAVLTITLAIASKVMAKRQALVRRPKAVEGGGAMTVLLTDKTGTLTANQMDVSFVWLDGKLINVHEQTHSNAHDHLVTRAMRVARLCNNDHDATEAALMRWVGKAGFAAVGDIETRAVEHQFDQRLKRMTTVHRHPDGDHSILTKGAPEHVLELCSKIHTQGHDEPLSESRRAEVLDAIRELAGRGLRVIALADRRASHADKLKREEAEQGLTLVGLLGIMDPPRPDVAPAVQRLAAAGIRTVMVTGDNPITAYEVARMVGIVDKSIPFEQAVIGGHELDDIDHPTPELLRRLHSVRVFARVTPQHKEGIVKAMQGEGFIIGMTGDGINDALALQQSDVGFAMGNGTDVAREASDVVLMDSRFGTIPNAVEEGRNVLHRIRLYLSYILSGNGCEVGAFIVAYIIGVPIPLTALVLLIINFATDSFPALAMAFEAGEKDVMEQAPRKRGVPFINREMWLHIGVQTAVATVIIMGVYYWALRSLGYFEQTDPAQRQGLLDIARSAAFMTYISQKLYRGFTARSMTRSLFEIGVWANRWTPPAVATSLAISLFFVYTPWVNKAMGLAPLDAHMLGVVAVTGLICPIVEEITKMFVRRRAV